MERRREAAMTGLEKHAMSSFKDESTMCSTKFQL